MERLSTSWFDVIADEGVIIQRRMDMHARAWLMVADELQLPRPLGQTLQRLKGVRDEAVSGWCIS